MTNPTLTHIAVIADRSGSMWNLADDMNGGLKEFLREQDKLPGTLKVDVTTFDSVVETPYYDADVSQVKFPVIVPRGSTALYDAIGQTVVALGERLAARHEDERPGKVLVVVVTDGQENASQEYVGQQGADRIKELVERQQDEYQWGFVFLGANIDSFAVGGGLGFRTDSVLDYAATPEGTTSMLRSVSVAASAYRGGGEAAFTEQDRQAAQQ